MELTRSSNWALATTAALSMDADKPTLPFTAARALGSPSRHPDPTVTVAMAWGSYYLP